MHRDVKPDNVVLGNHGETVLLDWGVARVRGELADRLEQLDETAGKTGQKNATMAGAIIGTPAYMAPEQAAARLDAIDERTDVFALGAILYHLLAGKPPYVGGQSGDIVQQAIRAEPAPLGSDVPPGLRSIVARAMARDPAARYQSAAELAESLESFTAEAVAAPVARSLRLFADVASWLGFVLIALLALVALRMAIPALAENPILLCVSMLLASLGGILSVLDARTRGRLSLSPLALAFAGTTILVGCLGSALGASHLLTAAASLPAGDSSRETILLDGFREALLGATVAAPLTALQLVMWAMARRRIQLAS